MGYLITLLAALALITTLVTGHNPLGSIFDSAKSSVTNSLFPKSEKEILVDDLNKQILDLQLFFADDKTIQLLSSKTVPAAEKQEIIQAAAAVTQAKKLLDTLTTQVKADKSLTQQVIQKALNLNGSTAPESQTTTPPGCKMICTQDPEQWTF